METADPCPDALRPTNNLTSPDKPTLLSPLPIDKEPDDAINDEPLDNNNDPLDDDDAPDTD